MEMIYKYPSCVTIKGYSRSVIQDLYYGEYFFIPNLLCDILGNINGKTIDDIIRETDDDRNIINEFICFLKEKDVIYLSEQQLSFKDLIIEFDYPAKVSNAIIEIELSNSKLYEIIYQLESLGCEHLQIYIKDVLDLKDYDYIFSNFKNSRVSSIDIITKYNKKLDNTEILRRFFNSEKRLFNIIFYDAIKSKKENFDPFGNKRMLFIKDNLTFKDCGCMHPMNLQNSMSFFTEAQKHNTCLNRKVYIDIEGNIKNCPAMTKVYGNIKDTKLEEAITKDGFKNLWYVNKDKIDVCKDCEFRYMCSDCRAFIKDDGNIYSQPSKCNYNPYVCKWDGQEGYVPVEECGTYKKDKGFVPDKEKIEELNKQIWGE